MSKEKTQGNLAEIVPVNGGEPKELVRAATPMDLLQMAMSQNADLAKLEKLMELQERFEKREAQKAFVAAMNAFKATPPAIVKNRTAGFESKKDGSKVSYDYATLDNVCKQITHSLSEHGITHRWQVQQKDGLIRVTCILTHAQGHSEETSLEGSPDPTGTKNAIQSIGSTVTYLQRYTLLAATGLAVGSMDNDGGVQKWEKLQEYLDSMKTAPNLSVLDQTFRAAYKEAMALKNAKAMLELVDVKDHRKKELASPNNGGPF